MSEGISRGIRAAYRAERCSPARRQRVCPHGCDRHAGYCRVREALVLGLAESKAGLLLLIVHVIATHAKLDPFDLHNRRLLDWWEQGSV